MDLGTIIDLVSGIFCGNVAVGLIKNLSLGTLGNSVVGLIGGGLGVSYLAILSLGSLTFSTATGGDMDIDVIIGQVAGDCVLLTIVGMINSAMVK